MPSEELSKNVVHLASCLWKTGSGFSVYLSDGDRSLFFSKFCGRLNSPFDRIRVGSTVYHKGFQVQDDKIVLHEDRLALRTRSRKENQFQLATRNWHWESKTWAKKKLPAHRDLSASIFTTKFQTFNFTPQSNCGVKFHMLHVVDLAYSIVLATFQTFNCAYGMDFLN